ncbi:hypothetical protein [Rhodospirillum sp. A1_3_36]|uniref:hypothetical protein n=1 Tax=Rhodospirillum sp. A1_3_36 TaxID=3391666 RepID=UPI0039A6C609
MIFRTITLVGAVALTLSACSTVESSPLIFGQGLTVGISVGPSTVNSTTPEMTVGVKQTDVAVVPTVVPKDIDLPNGGELGPRQITAHGAQTKDGDNLLEGEQDALSTFGSFSSDTAINGVKLGVFFATGVAAQNLSVGFSCAVDGVPNACSSSRKTLMSQGDK